jgi:hypothetical protein
VEERRVKKVLVVDQELLQAYRYFDKNRVGYLKVCDPYRRLLCSLLFYPTNRNMHYDSFFSLFFQSENVM